VNNGHKGLFQWDAERWAHFEKYAALNKVDTSDPMAQIKFADYELRFGTAKAAWRGFSCGFHMRPAGKT
jgi:hypothetical protein